MAGGGRDQVGETFEGDGVAILDELLHGIMKREDCCHWRLLVRTSRVREQRADASLRWAQIKEDAGVLTIR
ncbi:hypothetical protein KNHN1_09450 [Pseudomonas guariconensis]